jgi:hypothetical protein
MALKIKMAKEEKILPIFLLWPRANRSLLKQLAQKLVSRVAGQKVQFTLDLLNWLYHIERGSWLLPRFTYEYVEVVFFHLNTIRRYYHSFHLV